jgi:uncharacterized protein YutD
MTIPLFLRRRQISLRKYVNEKLFPDSEIRMLFKDKNKQEIKKIVNKVNDIVNECTFACTVFSFKQMFLEGTKAASEAVDTFKKLGIQKISIGKKEYYERNENVLEGDHLYNILLSSIENKELKNLIDNSRYFSDILDRYKNVSIRSS